MRTILINKTGKPEVMDLIQVPEPTPSAGEALIRVKSSGINFADIMARKGLYPDAPKLPLTPGYEVAGIISNTGPDVPQTLIGKKVIAFTRFGGYADYVSVPVNQIFKMPAKLDFEHAVSLPVAYSTAYLLMVVMGSLQPDETVLIQNAGSSVGLAALDIARHAGAKVIGTASNHKHEQLLKMGFEAVIDYRETDWEQEVRKYKNGRGIDLIIDPIGGKNWLKSYRALAPTGRLGMYGISSVCQKRFGCTLSLLATVLQMPLFHPLSFLEKNRGVFGVNMAHLWDLPEKIRGWMEIILQGVENGWVKPHIDRAFDIEKAADAHAYIESRMSVGKVVLVH